MWPAACLTLTATSLLLNAGYKIIGVIVSDTGESDEREKRSRDGKCSRIARHHDEFVTPTSTATDEANLLVTPDVNEQSLLSSRVLVVDVVGSVAISLQQLCVIDRASCVVVCCVVAQTLFFTNATRIFQRRISGCCGLWIVASK